MPLVACTGLFEFAYPAVSWQSAAHTHTHHHTQIPHTYACSQRSAAAAAAVFECRPGTRANSDSALSLLRGSHESARVSAAAFSPGLSKRSENVGKCLAGVH